MDLNKREDVPKQTPEPRKKGLLTYIMIAFVVPVMAVWESAKGLTRRVYDGGFAGPLRMLIGVLLGLAAGIGTGYYEGWVNDWSIFAWLPAGLAAAVGTFVYAWPLAYLLVVKPIQTASRELWDAVPERDHWFTDLLKVVARVAVFGCAAWMGWTQGGSAIANLHANGWGFLAYPGGFAWGAFVGLVCASIGYGIFTTTIYGVAAGSGLLLAWGLLPLTSGWLAHFGLTAPAWGYAGAALEFVLWFAFLFPLVHVVASHGLRFVKDLARKVYTNAYEVTVGQYEGVFVQLVNIWTAYHLASLTVHFSTAFGFALTGWLLYAVPAVVALVSYLLVGQIFRAIGNKGLGIVAAAHAVRWAVYFLAGLSLPWVIGGSAVAAALTFWLVYPLAYVLVRFVGKFVLDNNVAGYLVTAHDKACDAAEQLVKEVARARKNTYGDESWFAKLFLHVVNIATLLPVWYYTTGFLAAVGMSGWLFWGFTGLALVLSYLLIGRLLATTHNYVVGALLSLAGAVVTGVFVFAHQSHGLWVALPAAVVGGFLVAGWLFPIAYVFGRFLVSLIDGIVPLFSKLLEPLMRGIHEFCWKKASGLWQQFRDTYRMVRESLKPIWADINKAWSDAWQSVKDTWESIKRR